MFITLMIIALLIQFAGVYALLIHIQRTQNARSDFAEPANQRGHQAYYDAFAAHEDRREGIGHARTEKRLTKINSSPAKISR